jgi:ankyrin repeat protein
VTEILAASDGASQRLDVVNYPPVGYYGQTALQAAAMRGHYLIVKALIEAGADVKAPGGNNIHRNALELACSTGGCRYRLARPTLLLSLKHIQPGNLRLVQLLIEAGGTVDPKKVARYHGRTPLQAAAESGHEAVVLPLLDLGASINAPASPSAGVTALQAACFQGHVNMVRLLIARGADVNSPPARSKGYTALQGACLGGEEAIARLLLDSGADVNAAGSSFHGGTALHAAVSRGNMGLVNMLLSANANPNSQAGHLRQTPLQSAYLIGRQDIIAVLKASGATGPLAGGRILFDIGRIRTWTQGDIAEE